MQSKAINKPFTKKTKVKLLEALRRGCFEVSDLEHLQNEYGFNPIIIEVIDNRDKVDSNDKL